MATAATLAGSSPAIAWGKKVSVDFKAEVLAICAELQVDPNHLMACMAFESGESFSPAIVNAAGSHAVGLIQFMPATALALGTTVEDLAQMSAVRQLEFVRRYFLPKRGMLKTLSDVYMTILFPVAVGKPEDTPLFRKDDAVHSQRYIQNRGLDLNSDGVVTKAEAALKVKQKLDKGLGPSFFG